MTTFIDKYKLVLIAQCIGKKNDIACPILEKNSSLDFLELDTILIHDRKTNKTIESSTFNINNVNINIINIVSNFKECVNFILRHDLSYFQIVCITCPDMMNISKVKEEFNSLYTNKESNIIYMLSNYHILWNNLYHHG